MPDTKENDVKEELKKKDKKNLIEEENGRVVDILELLDNPISLDSNIRNRISVLQEHGKVSNKIIADRYSEKSNNIEDLDAVNNTLLEVCKALAIEVTNRQEGIVIDENTGKYDKNKSREQAIRAGILDLYEETVEKKDNINNKNTDKLLEKIFKEAKEKSETKLSPQMKNLFRDSVFDKDSIWKDTFKVNLFVEDLNISDGAKISAIEAQNRIDMKDPIMAEFLIIYSDIKDHPGLSENELEELKNKYPEYSSKFSAILEGGYNPIELDQYINDLAVDRLSKMMSDFNGMTEQKKSMLSEDYKKEFLERSLATLNGSTNEEFLKEIQNALGQMYPELNIFDFDQIAKTLGKSVDEVDKLIAGGAARKAAKDNIDSMIIETTKESKQEKIAVMKFKLAYSNILNNPEESREELDKLISQYPKYAERFSEIEEKSENDFLIEFDLEKGKAAKELFNGMMNSLEGMNDKEIQSMEDKDKKLFLRQSLATLDTSTDDNYLNKIQGSLNKLYPGKLNIFDPAEFLNQASEILNVKSDEIFYLISSKSEVDKLLKDSIKYLEENDKENSIEVSDRIDDEEVNEYFENESVEVGKSSQHEKTSVKEKPEEMQETNQVNEKDVIFANQEGNKKIGFFDRIKNLFNPRITDGTEQTKKGLFRKIVDKITGNKIQEDSFENNEKSHSLTTTMDGYIVNNQNSQIEHTAIQSQNSRKNEQIIQDNTYDRSDS